jgi:hypothetical protein
LIESGGKGELSWREVNMVGLADSLLLDIENNILPGGVVSVKSQVLPPPRSWRKLKQLLLKLSLKFE